MKRNLKIYENPILYLTILLIGIGTVMMYSASSTLGVNIHDKYNFYLIRHLIRLFIGIIAFIFIYNIDFKIYNNFSKHILILSWVVMLSAYLLNDNYPTKRWLIIFGKNIFTTSDFARIALIIFTASFIENNKKKINNINFLIKKFIPYFSISLLLIFFQPDLSTTFAIAIIITTMLLIAGLEIKKLAIPIIACIGVVGIKIYNTPFQLKRFMDWFAGNYNMQTENSIQALGNGGVIGVGIGKSIIKNGFMPEVHTDFILPIIGEEIGFIGIIFIFILYISLYFYGIRICKSAPDIFSSMLSIGITLNIVYYFLINASYVVGLFPTTGLPIPFISYGGSQLLFSCISIAILMNISRYINIYKYRSL
tara:strand:+ start:56 stop:1153 length:1098 start_codon:yes stop_codon:yes gene_type:complete